MALMKILADRNKLIEVTRIELQKMRVNMQKMQQQNIQLAQSNSLMLAELNSGKDRLRALQHELGCKNGLLAAMKLEVERRSEVKICEKFKDEVKLPIADAIKRSSKGGRDDDYGKGKKRAKSKSLGPSGQFLSKDEIENKRPCRRRQSACFKTEELKPPEDLSEIEDAKYSICQPRNVDDRPLKDICPSADLSHQNDGTKVHSTQRNDAGTKSSCARRQFFRFKSEEPKPSEDSFEIDDARFSAQLVSNNEVEENISACASLPLKNADNEGHPGPGYGIEGLKRSSLDRPLRQAAKKVHSYKEIPLNVKMRRCD